MPDYTHSNQLFERAQQLMPGGVSSPVRAFRAVGGRPLFIDYANGPYLFDVDGNRYIDYVLSWGPLILGHAPANVVAAISAAAQRGASYGAPSPLEVELAERVQRFMPNIEMVRFVNSGTEATMSALRLARAYTGRDKIIKFRGNYHGHADMLLVQAGSGVATLGLPDSPGVPAAATGDTLVAPYNDLQAVQQLLSSYPQEIAAIIVEPVAGNMGLVPPSGDFLPGLRRLATEHDVLLIFDEVMTGFRVHAGGAQTLYGVTPDLTTLGKVIGGGLPVGAYGGRRDVMALVAPSGPMYQAGTLSGNPLAMSAGIETLNSLQDEAVWQRLDAMCEQLVSGLQREADAAGVPVTTARVGSMFGLFFSEQPVTSWEQASQANTERFAAYFRAMLANGVYIAPSQFEAAFISTVHDEAIIDATLAAARVAFRSLA